MSQAAHAVHYRGRDGALEIEEFPSLAAAIDRVEQLRNEDAASDVRVFREVPIEVRTYYRVVATEPNGGSSVAAAAVLEEPTAAGLGEEPVAAVVAESPAPRSVPPSGAMVMSPPPVTVHPEASGDLDEGDTPVVSESRRALFSRG